MAAPARSVSPRDSAVLAGCLALALVARVVPEPLKDPAATALRRTVVAPLVALQRDAELSRKAWLERHELAVARDSVALETMALPAVRRENEQLRRLIGLGSRLHWGFIPAEILHGQEVGEEYAVTLSAGANAGVRPFSPVVAADGLVGLVKTVDPAMSIAILWSHPDFRVSAMAADGSAFGIAAARLSGEHNLLELRGVPSRSTLRPGMLIWSSGLGGVFPRGIPIGTVLAEDKNPAEAWARTYLLRPAVNPADVDAVMILEPDRVKGRGAEGVWISRASVDAAMKRIVAAGDSMAQEAAADSARQRAVVDSVAQATAAGRAPVVVRTAPAGAAAERPVRRDTTIGRGAVRRDSVGRVRVRADSARRPRGPRQDTIAPDTTAAAVRTSGQGRRGRPDTAAVRRDSVVRAP